MRAVFAGALTFPFFTCRDAQGTTLHGEVGQTRVAIKCRWRLLNTNAGECLSGELERGILAILAIGERFVFARGLFGMNKTPGFFLIVFSQ